MSSELSIIESLSTTIQTAVEVSTNQVLLPALAGLMLLGLFYGLCLTAVRSRPVAE